MLKGSLVSIHIAPKAGAPMQSMDSVHAVPGKGLEGDRYFNGLGIKSNKPGPDREITLVEIEAIEAIQRESGISLTPGDARRNLVTRGVALNHLVDKEFKVGQVTLRGVRLCEPCSYLGGLTRPDVEPALIHRGGLRAAIVTEGTIQVGDIIAE